MVYGRRHVVMEQVKVELGSVTYSKHFELTYVSGTQKMHPFLMTIVM